MILARTLFARKAAARNVVRHLPYMDGLRGVAVLSVVLFHAAARYNGYVRLHPQSTIGLIFRHGSHGVDLFFVISGFCLAYPTLARLNRDSVASFDVVRYIAHRIVRIVPPYYAAIAFFLLFAAAFQYFAIPLPEGMPRTITAADVLKQLLFIDAHVQFLNGSFWTLPVEFRWYFVFPIALWLWTVSPRAFLVALGAIVIATNFTQANSLDLYVLPEFLLGIVACAIEVKKHPLRRYALPACVVSFVAAIATSHLNGWQWYTNPAWSCAVFFLVVSAGAVPLLSRLLSLRVLGWTGGASYSIYLVHQPIVNFFEQYFYDRQMAWTTGMALAVFGGIAAGFVFSWLCERPSLEGPFRNALLAKIERAAAPLLARIGIPPRVALVSPLRSSTPAA